MALNFKEKIYSILVKLTSRSLTDVKTVFINDTTIRTLPSNVTGYAIKAIEDSVIAAITYSPDGSATSNTLVGETIAKGDVWYLKDISVLDLTSGAVFLLIH